MITPQSDIRASVSSSMAGATPFGAGMNGGDSDHASKSAAGASGNGSEQETYDALCERYAAVTDLDWPDFRDNEIHRLHPRKVTKGALEDIRKEGKRRQREREKARRKQEQDDAAYNANCAPESDDGGYISFGRYRMELDHKSRPGLYYANESGEPSFVCAAFRVLSENRDGQSQAWGLQLEIKDRDGRPHRISVPKSEIVADPITVKRRLADGGLDFGPRNMSDVLLDYLSQVKTSARTTVVNRCGWHDTAGGLVYVQSDQTIGDTGGDDVVLQADSPIGGAFADRGTVAEWRDNVAAVARDNSRLILAISTAFAGPLLDVAGQDGCGVNLEGASKIGKTTAMLMGVSVWGPRKHMLTWRATSNGLEGIAAAHNDCTLFLDELGQAEVREIGPTAYMLANGTGKTRSRRDGIARQPLSWRLLFLSTGEVGINARLAEVGQKSKAGQEVRLIGVPADAGQKHGIFEDLHGCADLDALANKIREAVALYHGTAGPAFVARLAIDRKNTPDKLATGLRQARDGFFKLHNITGSQGQVASVAACFALIAQAGELATGYDLTGWAKGDAVKALSTCFRAWLAARGSSEASLEQMGQIAQIRAFIGQHGDSRFQRIGIDAEENGDNAEPETYDGGPSDRRGFRVMLNRVGFRRKADSEKIDGETVDRYDYIFLRDLWASEVCKGTDPTEAAKTLRDAGYLLTDGDGRLTKKTGGLPAGLGRARCYVVSSRIMDAPETGVAPLKKGVANG
jgi:putative DNA primase/helicase